MKISKQNLKTRWKNKFMNQEQFNKNHVNFFMVHYIITLLAIEFST